MFSFFFGFWFWLENQLKLFKVLTKTNKYNRFNNGKMLKVK